MGCGRGAGSAVGSGLCVGGHFEEVEDGADIAVEPSQGLGDIESPRLDEGDGEATQAGGVLRSVASADAASVLVEGPVETVVCGVLDGPVPSVEGEEALGAGALGGEAGHAIDDFGAGLAARLVVSDAPQHEGLADAGEVEVAVEGGGGPDGALLDAPVGEGGRFLELGGRVPSVAKCTAISSNRLGWLFLAVNR